MKIFLIVMVLLIVGFGILPVIGEFLAKRSGPKFTEQEFREYERKLHEKDF